jgi:hypothetical protein
MDYKEIARILDSKVHIYEIDWAELAVERLVTAAFNLGNSCACQEAYEDGYAHGLRSNMEVH